MIDGNPDAPGTKGSWRAVHVRCEPGREEQVGALFFAAGFSGVREESLTGGTVCTGYTAADDSPGADDPVAVLRASLERAAVVSGVRPGTIETVETIPDEDWEFVWRAGLGPVEVGSRLVVRPSWTQYPAGGRIEIVIDPQMAFGTGGHETTRLCLEFLDETPPEGRSVLDCGCGSGVLAIAAAKLGAVRAVGFDSDPFSTGNARDNAVLNGVSDRVTILDDDLGAVSPGRFDLVLANIISGVLIPSLPRFRDFLLPGGTAVFSGLLDDEEELFRAACAGAGFAVRDVRRMNEWIAVIAS